MMIIHRVSTTAILTLSLLAAHIPSTRACEVMGFSFNTPVSGRTWFADFRLRGHLHVDGWGLAHYPDKSAQLFKEGIPAHQSALAEFLTKYDGLKSETMIAFLRTGSPGMGGPAHQNSHPFLRELNGRDFVLGHEGTIQNFRGTLPLGSHRPLGVNDSEFLTCYLAGRIEQAGIKEWNAAHFAWLKRVLDDASRLGSVTAMFSDGEYLFVHLDKRDANDLFCVRHQAPFGKVNFKHLKREADLGALYPPEAKGMVFATRPLTDEAWEPLPPGSLWVLKKGEVVFSSPEAAPKAAAPAPPEATRANVAYGAHERQVLDFYKAPSDQPTPVVFHIHGGGWVAGDKGDPKAAASFGKYLAAGISVVSINYRYSTQAQIAGVKPPVEWPLRDAARALQFVRSKAAEWNLDKRRIAATGGSAGACSSLWLAFHDDLADPKSNDPVARESTRLWCAAVSGAQTSLDPQQMKEWTPNSHYGGHAFGFMPDPKDNRTRDTRFAPFLAAREKLLPWIREYSPYEHVTADDPPVYLIYKAPPALGQPQQDPTHTANFGVKLREKLRGVGRECELVYPGAPDVKHPSVESYLIEKLKTKKR